MNVCARCGEEVRHGRRGTTTGWLHREEKDHRVVFGNVWSADQAAAIEAALDEPRFRLSGAAAKRCPTYQRLWPLEQYTTREHDLARYRKQKKFREAEERETADLDEEPDEDVDELPEPEVRARPISIDDFAPRSGIRQVFNLIEKTDGWEVHSLTYARGPYVGASGKVLSISDSVLLRARGPVVDSGRCLAVISWRDGAFDFAYTGVLEGRTIATTPADSKALKAWIKDTT